ncbi:MAG: apolipoprotein N-acyltransferase, partial [Alphaproteobacteria bacterium]|nr:apolipoprotein N-acyltransferase [Alphaproteobacteria bacterium]
GFPKGTGPEILKTPEGVAYAPLICYEAIFPQTGTGMKADLLINTTNDAWYGDSPGPYQHFTQARFRAVESGVPLLRAANTGISGLIDPLGRIVFQEPLMKEGQKTLNFPEKIDALLKIPYRLPSLFFLFALFLIRYFTVKKQ